MSRSESDSLGPHRLSVQTVPVAEGNPVTWAGITDEWRSYVEEKKDQRLVFIGDHPDNRDELMAVPYSHRFTDEYTRMQYAKIQDFTRGALEEYEEPVVVFLTRSTSTISDLGEPRHPVDHLEELLDAWDSGVRYELDKSMRASRKKDDYPPIPEWEYLRILEPTTEAGRGPAGYAHEHIAVVFDAASVPGEVTGRRFESVINKHVEKAPNALLEAHEFEESIEVQPLEELNNPGAYLFKYLGKSWDRSDLEEYEERFMALLWETGRRRFQPSDGAQRWMQRDEDESEVTKWRFAGVGHRDDVRQLLAEFDDYQEFRLATENGTAGHGRGEIAAITGLRGWLNSRRGDPDLEADDDRRGENLQVSHEEFYFMQKYDLAYPPGDRPPP